MQIHRMPASSEKQHSTRKSTRLWDLVPDVMPRVKQDIRDRWKRGVRIKNLASEYRLTVLQVEAIVWEAERNFAPPTGRPLLRRVA